MADPQAFEELVTRYQGVVCAVAYAVLRDRARSEEVAQEAFLIAWQKLPAMTPPPVLPAWVCGIARNLAANARRRRKETAMVDVDAPATGTPLDHVLDHEREQLATRALAELGADDREAIVLYYRGDSSIAEVAATLGITEVAARKRLSRGRDRLRSALAAVETTLRSTRPTPAFTAACVAGLAAYGARDASAARSSHPAKRSPVPFVAGGAAIAIAIGAGVAVTREPTPAGSESATPPVASGSVRASGSAAAIVRKMDGTRRTALLDVIGSIRGRQIARGGSQAPAIATTDKTKVYDFAGSALDDATPIDPPPTGSPLDKRGLRFAIRELQPMLLECYTANPRLPKGMLEVDMTLVGEPDIGTVVDSVELSGELAKDKDFAECFRETLYTIELPPLPSAGETWKVHYPFAVR